MGAESTAYFSRGGETLLIRATLRRKAIPRTKGNAPPTAVGSSLIRTNSPTLLTALDWGARHGLHHMHSGGACRRCRRSTGPIRGASSSLRLPKTKAGVCVSTVSIVGGRDEHVPNRARSHQSHQTALTVVVARGAGAACADPTPLSPMLLTVLTVQTVFSQVARILMILLPAAEAASQCAIPSARSCARP
jgi:hypothetical protein